MNKKNLKFKILLITLVVSFIFVSQVESAAAGIGATITNNLKNLGEKSGLAPDSGTKTTYAIMGSYINGLLALMGLLFLVLMIYGGFTWMTAAGNEDKVKKAKGIVKGAAIGIALILLALVITNFILSAIATAVGEEFKI